MHNFDRPMKDVYLSKEKSESIYAWEPLLNGKSNINISNRVADHATELQFLIHAKITQVIQEDSTICTCRSYVQPIGLPILHFTIAIVISSTSYFRPKKPYTPPIFSDINLNKTEWRRWLICNYTIIYEYTDFIFIKSTSRYRTKHKQLSNLWVLYKKIKFNKRLSFGKLCRSFFKLKIHSLAWHPVRGIGKFVGTVTTENMERKISRSDVAYEMD